MTARIPGLPLSAVVRARVQPRLEDHGGGGGVDHAASPPPTGSRGGERPLRLYGRQSLVLQLDGNLHDSRERVHERVRVPGPSSVLAPEGEREPDHDQRRLSLPYQLGDRQQLTWRSPDVHGADRHRDLPFGIGDRDPDPGVAQIEPEDRPGRGHEVAARSSRTRAGIPPSARPTAETSRPPAIARMPLPPAPPPMTVAASRSSSGAVTPLATASGVDAATSWAFPSAPPPSTTATARPWNRSRIFCASSRRPLASSPA